MAQRDYVGRGRSGNERKKTNRKKRNHSHPSGSAVGLVVLLLLLFVGGLYFITHHHRDGSPSFLDHPIQPGNGLPPKPEERWRYIKELENRQVGVTKPTAPSANNNEPAVPQQLSDEQRQLLAQIQNDMHQQPTSLQEVPANSRTHPSMRHPVNEPPPVAQGVNPFNNRSDESHQQPVTAPVHQEEKSPVKTETKPEKKVESKTENQPESKKTAEKNQHWLVQCGSFREPGQAESVRARLAFADIESHITSSGGWNRVVLGPYHSRALADKTLSRLKGVGMANCIPLAAGG